MGYRVPMAHGKLGGSGGIFPEGIFENPNSGGSRGGAYGAWAPLSSKPRFQQTLGLTASSGTPLQPRKLGLS